MHVTVNGTRLYFDVTGMGLAPDGPTLRERPTLLLLHGGPGFDHAYLKPDYEPLADVAQLVWLDHRGNGRSLSDDPSTWTLAQWGDDVRAFCDALGIERPIVLGVSFGGMVAQSYAIRHPDHVGKLVLVSTAAKMEMPAVFAAFETFGGAHARRSAEQWWGDPSPAAWDDYFEHCLSLYNVRPLRDPHRNARCIRREAVLQQFGGRKGEMQRYDFRADLARVRSPTLVMSGERDPITPVAFSETIARHLPPDLVEFVRFPDCGHGIVNDAPDAYLAAIRAFVTA
jgi:pimeloyl-ACP methyl ester carboxylesterase